MPESGAARPWAGCPRTGPLRILMLRERLDAEHRSYPDRDHPF